MLKNLLFILSFFVSTLAHSQEFKAMPTEKMFDSFHLIKVSPKYNLEDHQALMKAKSFIHKALGTEDWPSHELTEEQNLVTLIQDLEQFELGNNFTFHIFNKTNEIIGCIYLTPNLDDNSKASFSVFYWLVPEYQKSDFEEKLQMSVKGWLLTRQTNVTIDFPLN